MRRRFLREGRVAAEPLERRLHFAVNTFTSTGAAINLSDAGGSGATALNPYPKTISVTGLAGQLVNDVTVTLTGFAHTFPDDLDLMLVGPGGQKVMLWSDAGGTGNMTTRTFTLSDAAADALPDATTPAAGTYRPTDFDPGAGVDTFPAPAPAAATGTALSIFDGTAPNGTWSLYCVDDSGGSGDTGTIASWSLTIDSSPPNQPPVIGSLGGSTLVYTENAAPVLVAPVATVTDPDSTNFAGGTLTIDVQTGGADGDLLEVRNEGSGAGQIGLPGNGISFGGIVFATGVGGSGAVPMVLNFDADATPAAVQALIRNITYRSQSQNPATIARTVRFVMTDGDGGTSAPVTRIVSVTSVNDAPLVTTPPVFNVPNNVPAVFSTATGKVIAISDPDLGSADLRISLDVNKNAGTGDAGNVTLGSTAGLVFTRGDGTSDRGMDFHGTLAEIAAALSGLTYRAPAGYTGLTNIVIIASDDGNTGTGGPLTDTTVAFVNVTAADLTPPTATATGAGLGHIFNQSPNLLKFAFSEDVLASLSSNSLRVEATSGSVFPVSLQGYDKATNLATFAILAVVPPDGNLIARVQSSFVHDAAGNAMAADLLFPFFILRGDADHDRTVGPSDFNILASHFSQTGQTFSTGDFDYDGVVGPGDFNLLASRFGTTLPPPPGFVRATLVSAVFNSASRAVTRRVATSVLDTSTLPSIVDPTRWTRARTTT